MATVLSDDFSDANGTDLHGKALDVGGTWTVQNGAMDVQGGLANNASGLGASYATADAGTGDGQIECVVNGVAGSFVAILFRWADASNYWLARADIDGDLYELVEVNGGAATVRDSEAHTFNDATNYRLVVTLSGTSITCSVPGAPDLTFTSSFNETETEHGLYSGATGDTFNNFLMDDGAGGFDAATFPHAASVGPPRRGRTRVVSY